MFKDVYLTKEEYMSLQSKKINQGSDGIIYRVGNGILYKIYHEKEFKRNLQHLELDENGVRVFHVEDLRGSKLQPQGPETYVKLISKEAIALAKIRQKNVKLTTLPLAAIYIDNHFKGCVLKDYPHSKSIYFVRNFPFKYRLIVCLQILHQVKELLQNCIYRIDLGGKSYQQSNVLWNYFPKVKPAIIDNDGNSTIYTKEPVDAFYNQTISSLNLLMLEILYDYEVDELKSPESCLENTLLLKEGNVPDKYIKSLIYQETSLEELEEFLTLKLK